MKKDIKKFYDPKTYVPTKNAVPVNYRGTMYKSKAQCMALEGITRRELDEYLAVFADVEPPKDEVVLEEPNRLVDDVNLPW